MYINKTELKKTQGSFKCGVEKIEKVDKTSNEDVLRRGDMEVTPTCPSNANWTGHILRRNYLLHIVNQRLEGMPTPDLIVTQGKRRYWVPTERSH